MAPAEWLDAGSVTLRRWSPDWTLQLDAAINESKAELRKFMPWATETHSLPIGVAVHEFEDGGRPGSDEPAPGEAIVFDQGDI